MASRTARGRFEASPRGGCGSDRRFVAVIRAAQEDGLDRAVELRLAGPMLARTRDDPRVRRRVEALVAENREVLRMRFWPSSTLDPPAARRLAEITAPTLVIIGADDTPLMRAMAEAATAGVSGAVMEVVDETDHLPQMEKPVEVNRIVRRFLR